MSNLPFLSRRDAIHLGIGSAGWLAGVSALGQENAPAAVPELPPFNRFGRMMQDYYVDQIRGLEAWSLRVKSNLKNRADAEAYVKDTRERIARVFAPMPKKKSPLKPKITGTIERDDYTIEKIIFESRPNFHVTANLYLPKNRKGKVPGVIGTCGHSRNGKIAEAYQAFSQNLARMGYACLIYDPIGQGERSQYLDDKGELIYGGPTHEHNMAGNHMELVGEFLGTWRAWDGIRALDYLLTREEVDPKHIGVTGNSGGGTMTTWLLGVEPRWTMGAPSCFVTTWRRNLENELPQDNEQCPPRSLAYGLDHDDYIAAMAPKPVIILAKEKDYFDARGSEEVLERLRHLYGLFGKEENIQLYTGPTTHGYTRENREAMYGFFNSVTRASELKSEPGLTVEEDPTLWCTPTGQVVTDLKSRTVFHFTRTKAEKLKEAREENPLTGDALAEAVLTSLRMPDRDPASPPNVRILRARGGDRHYPKKYYINYAVDTEPGIQAVCTMLGDERLYSRPPQRPADGGGRVVLYIADKSSDAELREEKMVRELISDEAAEVPIFACDVRGTGESLPNTTPNSDPHSYYGADYFYAAYANMLNHPVLGGRTFDVLRVLDFLAKYGWDEVCLVGKGKGAIPAALAGFLDKRVKHLALIEALGSWHEIAVDEHYEWPLSQMLPGVLRKWDLPDVYESLAPKLPMDQ